VSLKELVSWLKRGQIVHLLREICPQKKCTPKSGRYMTAIARKLLTYSKLHTSAIECKEGLCISSRLVDFELLLELKIEQKKGTSLHTHRVVGFKTVRNSLYADRASVRLSDIFWILRVVPLGPCQLLLSKYSCICRN
jgi:hypothetical protein